MDRARQLGEQGIAGLLWRFSLPAVVGMLVHALYNVVDRIFIGRAMGSVGIAGISVAFPMMIILMAFGMLVGLGATSLISIRLGQQKKEEAETVMGNALVLFIIMSAALTILGLAFTTPILLMFGASVDILPYSREYLQIILVGTIFQSIGFGMNNFIRGEGNPNKAMSTMLIGAFLNILLDPVFIFWLDMGIRGAAIATVISQACSSALVLWYFLGGRGLLRIRARAFNLKKRIVLDIMAIGSAPFAMQMASSVVISLFNHQLRIYGGTTALSAMGIIFSILMLILMPVVGISQGAQPIIGYNYGAGNFDRVIRTLRLAALVATGVALAGFVLAMLFPALIISVFSTKDTELIIMGGPALRLFFIMLPVIGFQIVGANYFQAVGKAKQAIFLNLARQVLLLIPALLILPGFLGLNGVWLAGPVSDLGAATLTGTCLYWEIQFLKKKAGNGAFSKTVPVPELESEPAES
ncbi:MAG: MATE family efflux transporter [Desulfomonilia bacterium]|jgi:putative MATE family efflux protein|nr:MATE family efflux transporter [Desulfomonilia bacterium]